MLVSDPRHLRSQLSNLIDISLEAYKKELTSVLWLSSHLFYPQKYANCQRPINIIMFAPSLAMSLFRVLLNNNVVNSLYNSFTKKYPLSRIALSVSVYIWILLQPDDSNSYNQVFINVMPCSLVDIYIYICIVRSTWRRVQRDILQF
jgi:hypothetical protein